MEASSQGIRSSFGTMLDDLIFKWLVTMAISAEYSLLSCLQKVLIRLADVTGPGLGRIKIVTVSALAALAPPFLISRRCCTLETTTIHC